MGTAREGEAPAERYGIEGSSGSAGASPSHCLLMRNLANVAVPARKTVRC